MASERAFAAALQLLEQPSGASADVGLLESLEPLIAPLRHGLTVPTGVLGGAAARYRVYEAKEGRVAVAALEKHFETRLYEALGADVDADLAECFLARTASDWESWARGRDLPIVAVK
jgi:crotonobetainyl-CoA:carnitine CoA-transferase CaiB-like acyl-CoA transferase